MRRLVVVAFAVLLLAPPAATVTIDWVGVGDPGNAPDAAENCRGPDCGSVAYAYFISRYEVTNAQYAEFLNAKAASDPLGLYNPLMGTIAIFGGLARTGSSGSYSYAAKPGFEGKPVGFVSFYDALRFANWLHNGQGSGDTEAGAYTLLGGTAIPSNGTTVGRNGGAIVFLTSENEWYKAAYYSPVAEDYFDYPTRTDVPTSCVAPAFDDGNAANCAPYAQPTGTLTPVGAYALSESPWGTFDQGGNVYEWNEYNRVTLRGIRGGGYSTDVDGLSASNPAEYFAAWEEPWIGFRVASLVPEPGTGLLVLSGLLALAARRRSDGLSTEGRADGITNRGGAGVRDGDRGGLCSRRRLHMELP